MRIAVLAHLRHPIAEPYCGGLEAHTATTVHELLRRGHHVTLFAQAGSLTAARLVEAPDLGLTWGADRDADGVDLAERAADRFYATAFDAIEADRFDAVLNNTLSPVPYARGTTVPMLTVLHTPATLERVNAVLDTPGWTPGPGHAFAAVSETTRRDWAGRLPSVARIPNGVDLSRWRPVESRSGPAHAVWSGRITPEKGLHVAIAAVRLAGWRLHVSGPVSNPDYFAEQVVPVLGDGVSYRGHLRHDDLRAFLSGGSVLLFSPLWEEPFGLAAVEAMACGTPVAALPAGAAAEIVGPAGGVLARDHTPAALADAMVAAARLDRTRVRRSVLRYDVAQMGQAYEQAMMTAVADLSAAGAVEDVDLV